MAVVTKKCYYFPILQSLYNFISTLEQLIKENSSSAEPLEKITSIDDQGSDLTEPTFILSASKNQDLFTSNDDSLNFTKPSLPMMSIAMETPKSIPEKRINKGMK